jgi:virulence-associated protein VagC
MTTTLFMNGRSQSVRLPKEFRMPGERVSVRRVGDGLLLEPVKETSWPDGWFDEILISDEAFSRPPQGATPPAPEL